MINELCVFDFQPLCHNDWNICSNDSNPSELLLLWFRPELCCSCCSPSWSTSNSSWTRGESLMKKLQLKNMVPTDHLSITDDVPSELHSLL